MVPKRILSLFLLIALVSCTSSQKLLNKGQYDKAIEKSIRKLLKKPGKTEELSVLKRAYELANQADNDRIHFLRLSGQPDIWPEVFSRLEKLKTRQQRLYILSPEIQRSIGFARVDYDVQIIEAKRNAADYFFANGNRLLQAGDRVSARKAWEEFNNVKRYSPAYPDIDVKLNEARFRGMSFVYFSMENQSGIPFHKEFEDELLKISLSDLNSHWVEFHSYYRKDYDYAYRIRLRIAGIAVSPERVVEKNYSETKKVEDGWEYVLDKNGNVMKDSLGNDIKVKKYANIACDIIETQLSKSAIISGRLEFFDLKTNQLIKTDPISAENFFNHSFAVARGNLDALKPQTRELLKHRPIPFPSDPAMIMMVNGTLKEMSRDIIRRNRQLLR